MAYEKLNLSDGMILYEKTPRLLFGRAYCLTIGERFNATTGILSFLQNCAAHGRGLRLRQSRHVFRAVAELPSKGLAVGGGGHEHLAVLAFEGDALESGGHEHAVEGVELERLVTPAQGTGRGGREEEHAAVAQGAPETLSRQS